MFVQSDVAGEVMKLLIDEGGKIRECEHCIFLFMGIAVYMMMVIKVCCFLLISRCRWFWRSSHCCVTVVSWDQLK